MNNIEKAVEKIVSEMLGKKRKLRKRCGFKMKTTEIEQILKAK